MICKSIILKGRVQGVGFRYSCKNKAIDLGVKGYVKNCSDGSLIIIAEGELEIVTKFIEWCKLGPSTAHVDSIIVDEEEVHSFTDFKIVF